MPSSVVNTFAYDAAVKTLRVVFMSGAVYEYYRVPPAVYDKFLAASSKGIFLNKFIKGIYRYVKIAAPSDQTI